MPKSSIVSRLKEIERCITNITELQRMEKGECAKIKLKKPCTCLHHRETVKRLRDNCVCTNNANTGDFCGAKICQPQRQPCFCRSSKLKGTMDYSINNKPRPYNLVDKNSRKLNELSTNSRITRDDETDVTTDGHGEGIQVSYQDTQANTISKSGNENKIVRENNTERNSEENHEGNSTKDSLDKNLNQQNSTLVVSENREMFQNEDHPDETRGNKSFIGKEITSNEDVTKKPVRKQQKSKTDVPELRPKENNSELKIQEHLDSSSISKDKLKEEKQSDEYAQDTLSQSQFQWYEKGIDSSFAKRNFERLQKDLMNERKRTQELEEKLKIMTCSIECLKKEGEQRAACMREAMEKAEEQASLAARSRNVAMDLAKQSRDQTDIMKASKDELQKQVLTLRKEMDDVMCKNTQLKCECEELKCQLKAACENEVKKCAEVADEVGRIKCAVKQKEDIMSTEKNELQEMITELTNVVKIQKKKVCELTGICSKQQEMLQNKDACIQEKDAEMCDLQCKLKSTECKCHDVEEEIQTLKSCLHEEAKACDNFKRELERCKENYCCELKIKDKIILDQEETIKKLKKLLQESEKIAQQAAREFEQLTDQIYSEKQTNCSLRLALETAEAELANSTGVQCKQCEALESDLDCLRQQKRKALMAAKYAAEKLCETTKEYQREIECEKRQQRFLTIVVHKKEEEIQCLKQEILYSRQTGKRGLNNYMA
ncbi:early endosome antigen 1 isoform X2 [Cephus cinctus]|uniref:Early endosome antigen 1 isoform X2 n=1 Tax=Cephus cinctus TaxID=211228 RepID=A0AAJ7RRA5_CEPCN|nr:early endosome antigen 1 isoform X2 [Cephus cinctus]